MTEAYREAVLTEARLKAAAARAELARAGTLSARLKAAEELEFWSNKVAFLANVRL